MARLVAESTLDAPPDTYFYRLAHQPVGAAVIGSDDALRLFDPRTLKAAATIKSCNAGVTCLETFGARTQGHSSEHQQQQHQNVFTTAGRDGLVRLWDTRASTRTPALHLSEPRSAPISALICHSANGNLIAAGTESTKEGLGDVSVVVYDIRSPNPSAVPVRQYTESHTDSITQLSFHPSQPDLLLSGSTDGLISIFDTTQSEEEDALVQVLNPRSAVHCAGFFGTDAVYVLSTDEQLWIYGLDPKGTTAEDEALPILEAGDVRGKLGCMYVVDMLFVNDEKQQQQQQQPVLVHGHNENKTLEIVQVVSSQGFDLGERIGLPGAHGEEVVRDLMILGTECGRRAISCGEDGFVRLWDLGGGSGEGSAKQSRKQSRKEKKADRYTPY
ncbi:WD40 repeat-like protein [Polychaeton citri CBS 116435]|uniref:WD40 repeat-like protein n=1 Tax=Polychaeton citri CBS 116435 TaxID=1314669 RepID=A0A9P4Q6L9_9PEZI|nr:WD40 repeat-like protein [Polychaeton citri CBS 116435]